LPTGLDTSPLTALDSLLGLLPGMHCGGSAGSGFIGTIPSHDDPCPPLFIVVPVLLAVAEGSSDNTPTPKACTPSQSEKRTGPDLCADNGEIFLSQFTCQGGVKSMDCCLTEMAKFTHACWLAHNDAQRLPSVMTAYAVCCKKK
jgi:hypothetical protein